MSDQKNTALYIGISSFLCVYIILSLVFLFVIYSSSNSQSQAGNGNGVPNSNVPNAPQKQHTQSHNRKANKMTKHPIPF